MGALGLFLLLLTQTPEIKPDPAAVNQAAVEAWLGNNLKDPQSLEVLQVASLNDHRVLMRFRAKNSFGGYEVEMHTYEVSTDGQVTQID